MDYNQYSFRIPLWCFVDHSLIKALHFSSTWLYLQPHFYARLHIERRVIELD